MKIGWGWGAIAGVVIGTTTREGCRRGHKSRGAVGGVISQAEGNRGREAGAEVSTASLDS